MQRGFHAARKHADGRNGTDARVASVSQFAEFCACSRQPSIVEAQLAGCRSVENISGAGAQADSWEVAAVSSRSIARAMDSLLP